MAKKVDTTIVLRLNASTGEITVDPGPDDECHASGDPPGQSRACGWTRFRVSWTSVPSNLDWRIEFDKASPFVNGAHTFRNRPGQRGGLIREEEEDGTEYKYTISYPFQGETKVLDPKIVIQDSEPFLPPSLLEVRERLGELSARTEELAGEVARLERMVDGMIGEAGEPASGEP